MTSPFHSPRDVGQVLGTYRGAELLHIEQALTDDRLDRRSWSAPAWWSRRRAHLPTGPAVGRRLPGAQASTAR